jgi:hypothetical protein
LGTDGLVTALGERQQSSVDFDNRTRLEAAVLRGDLPGEDKTLAVIVAKASGVFDAAGRMTLDLAIPTPICHAPVPYAGGQIPADLGIRKDGLDVLALGQAYHPQIDGGVQSEVVVQLGEDVRRLQVWGERRWYKSHDGHWKVSDAQPFSIEDLTWSGSFGGPSFDDWGNPCPHLLNAKGKGYIASEAAIEGTPLPNFEHPAHLITDWRDQPAPCNLAPAPRHLAVDARVMAADVERSVQQGVPYCVPDSLWNDAVPLFRFRTPEPGTPVSLTGMSEEPLFAAAPALRVYAKAQVGAAALEVPLVLDTLLFLPAARRVLFTFRGSFAYHFAPREQRCVTLEMEG